MDIENLIKDTFAEHEHVVPDGERVLAGARQRIDRRRAVLSRPLVVAAGVVALTLAAVTVVALNRSGSTPADDLQVAGPANTASTESGIADLTMPYSLGWVPEGDVEYLVHRTNTGATAAEPDKPLYGGEYMLTVTNGAQVLYVDVQHMGGMTVDDAAFKSGPGKPLTINGQPAVESTVSDGPGGYELYVTHPDGGAMYVNVSADHGTAQPPAQQLIDAGRRIAENIQFPGTTTVTPTFGLGTLPNGLRMCSFDVEKPFESPKGTELATRYSVGTCDTMPPVNIYARAAKDLPTGTPGQPVQDHETSYVDEDGYLQLFVHDAVHGDLVVIAAELPLTDLYAIADGLVLPTT